jgi:hypothetical protein
MVQMEYSKDQLKYSIHKKSYEYYLIIPNVVNSQEQRMQICMNMKYIPTWTPKNPYPKIFKLVQKKFTL